MKSEHNQYLLSLRDSGMTNMWFATPYIEDRFRVDSVTAVDILSEWMESFEPGGINGPKRGDT
jgi:hypothetical protein